MRLLAALNLALAVTTTGACGGGSSEGGPAIDFACDHVNEGTCFELLMADAFLVGALEDACRDGGWVAVASCSQEGVVGIRTAPLGATGATSRRYDYSGSPYAVTEADCNFAGGTWMPGPS